MTLFWRTFRRTLERCRGVLRRLGLIVEKAEAKAGARIAARSLGPAESITAIAQAAMGENRIVVVDVGSRGGSVEAWWRLPRLAKLAGFEPDAAECARLNASRERSDSEEHYPLALGAERRKATLYVTDEPAMSSLYPPDPRLAERFPELRNLRVRKETPLELTPLDSWWQSAGRPDVRFVKLDTQGSELDILRGAGSMLSGCVGCEVETEFSPHYTGQPLFADIDPYLRKQGFVLWRLRNACHYTEDPRRTITARELVHYDGQRVPSRSGSGRLYWADAIYFRDPHDLPLGSARDADALLCLAALFESLGDWDAARTCLTRLREAGSFPTYRDRIDRKLKHLEARQGVATA